MNSSKNASKYWNNVKNKTTTMQRLILSLFLSFSIGYMLPAASWYVAVNGNDAHAGTLQQPFLTLTAAIDAASPGDQIWLRGGQYFSNEIRISKSNLHISSYPGKWASIAAPVDIEDISACLWYDEPEVTGGTLENLDISGGYYYAIKFETNWDWDNSIPFAQRRGVSQITVRGCHIHHSGRDAVKLTPACANIQIISCEIDHTGVGPGAQLDFNAEGIDNVNAPGLHVKDCIIHDIATTGIYIKGGGRDAVIEQNIIQNCGEGGIYLGFYTDAEWFDTDANPEYFENINGLLMNNIILNTHHAGIGLWGAKDAKVYNNTVVNTAILEHTPLFFNTTEVWIDENTTARTASQNVKILNNIFVQTLQEAGPVVRVRDQALAGNNQIDYNAYYGSSAVHFLDDQLDWQEWSMAQWQTQTNRDLHSIEADPRLGEDLHLLTGSPCINAGTAAPEVTLDCDGHSRMDGMMDMGADEYATVVGIPQLSTPADHEWKITGAASDVLNIEIQSTQNQTINALLMDQQGRVVEQFSWPVTTGKTLRQVPGTRLPAGLYWLSAPGWPTLKWGMAH